MAIEFAEREEGVPDTIPDALVRAHGRTARRMVTRSKRRHRVEAWTSHLTAAAMTVALLGAGLAAALFAIAIPLVRVPMGVIGLVACATLVRLGGARLAQRLRRGN